jgi:hypothetical protein
MKINVDLVPANEGSQPNSEQVWNAGGILQLITILLVSGRTQSFYA